MQHLIDDSSLKVWFPDQIRDTCQIRDTERIKDKIPSHVGRIVNIRNTLNENLIDEKLDIAYKDKGKRKQRLTRKHGNILDSIKMTSAKRIPVQFLIFCYQCAVKFTHLSARKHAYILATKHTQYIFKLRIQLDSSLQHLQKYIMFSHFYGFKFT